MWHRLAGFAAYRCALAQEAVPEEDASEYLLWQSHPGRFQSESTRATRGWVACLPFWASMWALPNFRADPFTRSVRRMCQGCEERVPNQPCSPKPGEHATRPLFLFRFRRHLTQQNSIGDDCCDWQLLYKKVHAEHECSHFVRKHADFRLDLVAFRMRWSCIKSDLVI